MADLVCTSVTHALPIPDVEAGLNWYARLFGREPDLVPAPFVYEWKLRDGVWVQVGAGTTAAAGSGQVLRLGVVDLHAAVESFVALGGQLEELTEIPGVITIQGLRDPFGNRLSFYEEAGGVGASAF